MERQIFLKEVESFLLSDESNKEHNISSIDPSANLWDLGLVDSFRIMELILFLEDILGKEINVESNFIRNFHTMDLMYESLVLDKPLV